MATGMRKPPRRLISKMIRDRKTQPKVEPLMTPEERQRLREWVDEIDRLEAASDFLYEHRN